ncbi:MAG: hypothetical protein QXY45_00995 [Candidatus Aenigmatarchaeota archaeon]
MSKSLDSDGYWNEVKRLRVEFEEKLRGNFGEDEVRFLLLTFDLAARIHEREMRRTGRYFIQHPYDVALYLFEIGMDPVSIATGLLHDTAEAVIEENGKSREEAIDYIRSSYLQICGDYVDNILTVMSLVSALTRERGEIYYDSIARIFSLGPEERSRTLIIKAGGDRRFNVIEMEGFTPQEKLRSAYKSLCIAHEIKRWLISGEDVSLRESVERAFRDLVTYTNAAISSVIAGIIQKYQRQPEIGKRLIELEYESDIYCSQGGYSKVTQSRPGSHFDGIIEKYDQMIRTHEISEQDDIQIYADALGLKKVLTLLLLDPTYLIEGFSLNGISYN